MFSLSLVTIEQFALCSLMFGISLGIAIFVIFLLKDLFVNKFGSSELQEANMQINQKIDDAEDKTKMTVRDFINEQRKRLGIK